MSNSSGLVLWLTEVRKEDIRIAGGKGANLGEMIQAGFPVPSGFVISAYAYTQFIKENNLTQKIKHALATVDYHRPESLLSASSHIKKYIMQAEISHALIIEIFSAYKRLGGMFDDAVVAVRSSATAEDLPDASFAGQQETFLNVSGEANLIQKVKEAWASLFEARAIFYRHEKNFNHFKVGIAIVVQRMVASEQAGVMFTIDPVTHDKSKIIIEAIHGLGEYLVQGHVTPDHYEVSKKDFLITKKVTASQEVMLQKIGKKQKKVPLSQRLGNRQKISDKQILQIAEIGKKLEHHYYFAQDCEWAIEKGMLYIVQTRPVTSLHRAKETESAEKHGTGTQSLEEIVTASPGAPGIASGPVTIIRSQSDIQKIKSGDILVAHKTDAEFEPVLRKARAVVTETGGRTSHAAHLSREIGIPAVVGAANVTQLLKQGQVITINGTKGTVHKGAPVSKSKFHAEYTVHNSTETATKIYVTLSEPDSAKLAAQQKTDGIGLLEAEKIITGIGIHPKKLFHEGKKQYFIEKLVEQLSVFCETFSPRPVIYRPTDFTTAGYRSLTGGKTYEPLEPNPMLGYRGAFRYMHDPEIFSLEIEAIKTLRNKKSYKNIWLTLPYVRSVRELIAVKRIIAASGLHRAPTFKVWMNISTPANIFMIDQCIDTGIDGFIIDSDTLTTLISGTDRFNEEVTVAIDDLHPGILWAYERIITTASKRGASVLMSGHAPSQYPSLVEHLVKWGISGIIVFPNAVETTREVTAATERRLITKRIG